MHIEVERDRCVASVQCNLISPRVFDQDDDGIVTLLIEDPDPTDHDDVLEAVRVCPAQAIRVAQ